MKAPRPSYDLGGLQIPQGNLLDTWRSAACERPQASMTFVTDWPTLAVQRGEPVAHDLLPFVSNVLIGACGGEGGDSRSHQVLQQDRPPRQTRNRSRQQISEQAEYG